MLRTVSPMVGRALRDIVRANRVLANEGVVDAFGHVSMRHPEDRDKYLLARARAPEVVEESDILEFRLDGEPVAALREGHRPYAERMIHGSVYETRPEVNAVIHNHSYDVIPFAVTDTPLRPITHTCAPIGASIPVWDIRDGFGETNHLVVTMEQGRDLCRCLSNDVSVVLMKRHGCVVTGDSLRAAVMRAIYLQVNAKLQLQALQLSTMPDFLTRAEVQMCSDMQLSPIALDRAWEVWCRRAGSDANDDSGEISGKSPPSCPVCAAAASSQPA